VDEPARTIQTERLGLREPEETDVEALRDYHRRNAERFARFDAVPGDEPAVHRDWVIAHRRARWDGQPVAFLAFDRASTALAGLVAYSGFDADLSRAMINYSIDGAYEGKGYAFEMVSRAVRYAFEELGLASVAAQVLVGNERSLRLVDRLGFVVVARSPVIPGVEHLLRPHIIAVLERTRFGSSQQ
jgi:RimJ/RimL family protein N-acetyltransferase